MMAAYGSAHFGISTLMEAMLSLLVVYYAAEEEGADTVFLGVLAATGALAIGRVVDGLIDPIIGNWSGISRSSLLEKSSMPKLSESLNSTYPSTTIVWLIIYH